MAKGRNGIWYATVLVADGATVQRTTILQVSTVVDWPAAIVNEYGPEFIVGRKVVVEYTVPTRDTVQVQTTASTDSSCPNGQCGVGINAQQSRLGIFRRR